MYHFLSKQNFYISSVGRTENLMQCGVNSTSLCIRSRHNQLYNERSLQVRAKKQQQKKKRSAVQPVDRRIMFEVGGEDADDERFVESWQGNRAPSIPEAPTPSTSDIKSRGAEEYIVFAPKASSIQQVRGGAWGWGEEEETSKSEPQVPEWNPRTGFMRAPISEAEGEGSGVSASTSAPVIPEVRASMLVPPNSSDEALPSVSRDQILSSCLGSTFWMTALALFLRQYAQVNAPVVLGTDSKLLSEFLMVPSGLGSWENLGLIVLAVAAVTGARLQLLNLWQDFRVATNRSNRQILEPLGWLDIFAVAVLSGWSEELLFRGAIIPGSFLDWRGALLSGLVFGILHNSGGRNLAFAGWASAVGTFYGGLFVYTHNIWVPVSAHAIANFCSAAVWKSSQK
ncbi:hypothetical protein CEUSTIGMA_g388.t1 [Chlamydomonas eustigma]|uniref:CAAX prenyl protease 2/Lysostaphin resistance protein A-like domain-containing protein n=1 Tax=Chlamydomonas eustigma TaxID=1157962 RepID=A0A250WQ35_9CHLO|nr:hypothetical protein CEUSTIGMA_g388.t1 [Chlamydomonas eustigma]|eukprot:GAX72933.1 hypothetical protein CEUSTIGMA_g388.t1 [Chlamydomonas eustigma]